MPSSASSSAVPPAAQLLPAADMERYAAHLREGAPPGAILAKLRAQGVADPEAVMRALEAQRAGAPALANRTRGRSGARKKTRRRRR